MEKIKTTTPLDRLIHELGRSNYKACYAYVHYFSIFWFILMVIVPTITLISEIIKYGSQKFGTGFYNLNLYSRVETVIDRMDFLALTCLVILGFTISAIENSRISKYPWMLVNAIMHIVLFGSFI
jgi:hypothetical protein